MLGTVGCAPAPSDNERIGSNVAPIYRGTNGPPGRETSSETTGPSAAVGELSSSDGGFCSAVAITRTTIVTAQHCFCLNPVLGTSFTLPQTGFTTSIVSPFVTPVIMHPTEYNICLQADPDEVPEMTIGDVIVLQLTDPIPVAALPELPDVHLGNDILATAAALGNHVFVVSGFGGTVRFNSSEGAGKRREGYIGTNTLQYDCARQQTTGLEGWFLEADANCLTCDTILNEDQATIAPGDSGGGLFLQPLDANNQRSGRPILVGINSGYYDYGAIQTQHWASTGNREIHKNDAVPATSNAALIMQGLGPDSDGDGFVDAADNCAPPICITNCANPDQLDRDGDGRGDACDPCPNIPDDGKDADEDGLPNACDTCPLCPNCDTTDFFDLDGAGAGCDNCPNVSNIVPCTLDSQCTTGSDDFCNKRLGNVQGVCARQPPTSDTDNDGLGDVCDPCPNNRQDGDFGIFANSNWQVENDFPATRVNDVCDEVPVFVARPIVRPFEDTIKSCSVAGEMETCIDSVQFYSSSSLGSTTNALAKFPPVGVPVKAPVGFRHCDCHDDDGFQIDREECTVGQCLAQPGSYEDSTSAYRRITITTNSVQFPMMGDFFPANFQESTFAERKFSNDLSFTDTFPHPEDDLPGVDELETARLGPTETITWRWRKDVAAGHIAGFPTGAPLESQGTAGIFETVVRRTFLPDNSPLVASTTRDGGGLFPQRMRRMHTYVVTPLAREAPFITLAPIPFDPCSFLPCGIILNPGVPRINPNPTVDPFPTYRTPIRIVNQGGTIYGSTQTQTFDPTPILSPIVETLVLEGSTQWLRPIEQGVRITQLGSDTQFVALPNTWTETSRIREIVYDGVYRVRNERVNPLDAAESNEEPSAMVASNVPTARMGARGLLSLERNSVFMVGGKRPSGRTTGEVWRYDLKTQQWHQDVFDAPRIEEVLALTYDDTSDRMLVLQRVHPPKLPSHIFRVQLVLLDYRTHQATLVDDWPVANTFARISLTARQNGSFVFLGSTSNGQHVKAYRFELTNTKTLKWTGTMTMPGQLLDEPAIMDSAIVAPLLQNGHQVMKMITDTDFVPPNKGWVNF